MISQSEISYVDNSDIIGSIKIDKINLSNLLLQGLDNTYYFNHNYLKEKDKKGEIFLDYQGDLFYNKKATIYTNIDNVKNYNNIGTDDIIEVFYLYKTLCYKVINKPKKSDLVIRIIDAKNIEKIYAKKVNC